MNPESDLVDMDLQVVPANLEARKRRKFSSDCDHYMDVGITSEDGSSNPSKINSSLNTGSFVLLKNLPSGQAAFSIEKIRKIVFSYSSPKDLVKFRLVCRDWYRDANDALPNGYSEVVIHNPSQSGGETLFAFNNFKQTEPNSKKFGKLSELTKLLDQTGSNRFPCSQFVIQYNHGKDNFSELEDFLSRHGRRIRTLDLALMYYKVCDEPIDTFEPCGTCSHGLKWVLQFLRKLLLEQAPNLNFLKILFLAPKTNRSSFNSCAILSNDDDQIEEDEATESAVNVNENLKYVTLMMGIPVPFFHSICKLAPNLKEVRPRLPDLNPYLEPTNRLHLLQSLSYTPHSLEDEEIFKIEDIAYNEDEGGLQLRELDLFVEFIEEDTEEDQEFDSDICNRLLTKSCKSLTILRLTPLRFLPGFKIPQMPNVWCIYLKGGSHDEEMHFFPAGMLLSETFPKLEIIVLSKEFLGSNPTWDKLRFVLGSENEIISSVKAIRSLGNKINLGKYEKCFPNAVISD